MSSNWWAIFPNPVWSIVSLIVIGSVLLYFVRIPAHRAILSLGRVLHGTFRIAAKSMLKAEQRLEARNREVLMAHGREAAERIIEREFERIEGNVRRDIGQCSAIDRLMNETITKMEEDYQRSKEVPPAPPGWANVVKAIAEVPSKGDPMVVNILEQIHESLIKSQDRALTDYRAAVKKRNDSLQEMKPAWRELLKHATEVDKKTTMVIERSKTIDNHMDHYEEVLKKSDRAQRMLSSSQTKDLLISTFGMAVLIGGALVNFNLIARPMAEMVGGTNFVGNFKISEIAAMVIILLETALGLYLMESLRFTRLFPIIGALPDKMRRNLMYFSLGFLFVLATVEAGLAFMREILMEDELATSAALRGDGGPSTVNNQFLWITTAAQMLLGFSLPFVLSLVAIPLEMFVQSLRSVSGIGGSGLLRGLAVILRMIGNFFRYSGELLVDVYDFVCFPLWIERVIKSHKSGEAQKPRAGGQAINQPAAVKEA